MYDLLLPYADRAITSERAYFVLGSGSRFLGQLADEDIAEDVFAFEETVERSTTAIISPGARYAFNLPNEAK